MLGMLLVITPFSGIRVSCIDAPTDVSGRLSAPTEIGADCERLCPLRQASSTANTEGGSGCALSADVSSLSLFASIAVLGSPEPLQIPLVVPAVYADSPRFYLEPDLAHLGPPPKPEAL